MGKKEYMADSFYQRQQKVVDRYLQSSFGLWSALLTVNGILLAVFSLVQSKTGSLNSILVQVVVGACVISLILLVYNFLATKLTYYRIGEVMSDEEAELTKEDKDSNIRKALSRGKFVIISERACLVLLALEAAIVLLFVINSTGG
jgi:hypothetical protein